MKPETDAWWIKNENKGKNTFLGVIVALIKAITIPYKAYGYIKSKYSSKRIL